VEAIEFIKANYRAVIEILILWGAIYAVFRSFKNSRARNIFLGIGATLLFLTVVTVLLDLKVVEWILSRVAALLALGLLVIFQPELRSAFARIGSTRRWLAFSNTEENEFIDELAETVQSLSRNRHGALIALERSIGLSDYEDTGVSVDAKFTQSLTECIFHPKTTLHDGGVFISKRRIVAAGCLFPVSQRELNNRALGLRHRAALGLAEETDAVAIIVSEETGNLSVAYKDDLHQSLEIEEFKQLIRELLGTREIEENEESI